MPASKTQLPIGGLWINVFGLSELLPFCPSPLAPDLPAPKISVLFFLHGRFGSAERIEHLAQKAWTDVTNLEYIPQEDGTLKPKQGKRWFIVVTLDHRNHGTRKISEKSQKSWREGNPKHAQDMYAQQTGTANDVSFLIDFMPSFIFPSDEAVFEEWMIAGISLGGHATWLVLRNEPRIKIGVPFLGCPSYRSLLQHRAGVNGLSYAPPHMPASLDKLIALRDPDAVNYTSSDGSENPYIGKKILVLNGAEDQLVPFSCCKEFVDGLEVGPDGVKEISVENGVAHETTAGMVKAMVRWICSYGMTQAP